MAILEDERLAKLVRGHQNGGEPDLPDLQLSICRLASISENFVLA